MTSRRKLLLGVCSGSLLSLSGCTNLFSSDNGDSDPEPETDESIEIPHNSLENDHISTDFITQMYQYLESVNSLEISLEQLTEDRTENWVRSNSQGLYTLQTDSDGVIIEEYYTTEGSGRNELGSVTLYNQAIPNIENWGQLNIISQLSEISELSLVRETEQSIIYEGETQISEITSEDTSEEITVVISKQDPVISEIITESIEYQIININNTSVEIPEWYEDSKDQPSISGGVFESAESLIIEVGSSGGVILEGTRIDIIDPNGEVNSVTIQQNVSQGESIYIAYQESVPVSSIGSAPSISNRSDLLSGTYICVGYNPNGSQIFEQRISVE